MNSYKESKYFTLNYYKHLISKHPTTLLVMDYHKHKTGLILRHDVDLSLDLAFEFSRIEKKNSIVSTYYILLTSVLYNPFSKTSQEIIKTMIDEGFEIGLHFDPLAYGSIPEKDLLEKFYNEIDIFESVFNFKIKSYSHHNPSIHGQYTNYEGVINAYNTDIFSDECFISDSMFSFRGKDPGEFIEKSKHQLVQFLTHPVHYFSNANLSYEKPINLMMNKYYMKIDEIMKVNNIYKKQKKNYEIDIKRK